MTWLFSLYWLGAFAVAGPILFHMWRRTPRGERPFSTLMFLAPSPPRLTSRSRIEHWLLLLLRTAALALLAFAFTRPLWRAPIAQPDEASTEQLLAVLVDTSASMRRENIWQNLIQELDERLSQLPPQTLVGLYRFDRHLVPVADFHELKSLEPTARRDLIRIRLRELAPTWENTRLGEALVRTATTLQEAQTERAKPASQRIWLASDLQSGAETVALQGYEWPDDLPVEVILAQAASPSNAGLQVVERNLEAAEDVVRVRVTNSSDSLKEQLTLKWDAPGSGEVSVYVPPGQSRTLLPPARPTGVLAEKLLLQGDDNDFDNRVYITDTPLEKRLVVYCGPETQNDTDGARFYLEQVFSASQRYQIDVQAASDVNTAAADSQPSLIVLVQPDAKTQPLIQRHLESGGMVIVAAPNPDATLTSLALCGRRDLEVTEANVSRYAMMGDIDFNHSIFAPFAESQFSDFTGIRFWKHRTIAGLRPAIGENSPKTGEASSPPDQILARFDDDQPAVIEFPFSKGRVVIFTAGWQPADSQFARSSKFPMLMFRLLEQSTGVARQQGNQFVGDSIAWPTASTMESSATGSAHLPSGMELTSMPLSQPFAQTEMPGLYALSVPGRTEQIAVNLAADESRTAPLTIEQLESFGLKLKSREKPIDPQLVRDRQRQLQLVELEQSQKLWQAILVAVVLVLLAETFLGRQLVSKEPA
ncbi:BatA domain-containing protein [Schlesneria paludicola]|uniref:BatA domain-containing protein n=1 Tax=Schlesneria paludicola TaxID=360056 RepID=UPI00029A8DC8|nr:BatA domain-containing protein [Schlesneria paludicola]